MEEEKHPSSAIMIKSVGQTGDGRTGGNEQSYEDSEPELKPISDKYFYKEMAKIKEKGARGTSAVPPKKSASAYIIFQKEVSCLRLGSNLGLILSLKFIANSGLM